MSKKTEIEFELNETIAYSRRGERVDAFCPICEKLVQMATAQIAAILTQSSEREVFRQLETGNIHFIEIGRVMICLNSLTNYQKTNYQKTKEILET